MFLILEYPNKNCLKIRLINLNIYFLKQTHEKQCKGDKPTTPKLPSPEPEAVEDEEISDDQVINLFVCLFLCVCVCVLNKCDVCVCVCVWQ